MAKSAQFGQLQAGGLIKVDYFSIDCFDQLSAALIPWALLQPNFSH